MRSSIVRPAAISSSTPFSASARRCWLPSASAASVAEWNSIRFMSMPQFVGGSISPGRARPTPPQETASILSFVTRGAMAKGDKDSYEVGFGKPPRSRQFKPGQSGNPDGRPRGAKNFATAIEQELVTQIPVTDNGRRRRISKREVIAKHLVNKAASGDL